MASEATPSDQKQSYTLIYAAFIAGLCSIIYELLIATTASYFLGDSVKYFSLTIGIYMAAMGVGSFLSQYIEGSLLKRFIIAELLLGFLGGISIPLLYFAYAFSNSFIYLYITLTVAIGFLIGLEIPFLTRLMERYNPLKFNIANILSFDYLGALIATTAFPFLLLPVLGVYQTSLLFGLVNMSIGFAVLLVFSDQLPSVARRLKKVTLLFTTLLLAMMLFSGLALTEWDRQLYSDRVIHSQQTPYQKIVMTKHKEDIRLFIDGNLQFSSIDEHRYHESLVHVPLALYPKPVERVLLLGAGDGLAVRELLKHDTIKEIVLVDLDPAIIELARSNPYLKTLNQSSLTSSKVNTVQGDAFTYLKENVAPFDFIISDLPDPNNNALERLYTQQFYRLIEKNLAKDGLFITQATSPYFATEAFWSIVETIKSAPFRHVAPFHTDIPTFGNWGFVIASHLPLSLENRTMEIETRFLNKEILPALFIFGKDIQPTSPRVNRLDRPTLLDSYLKGWKSYSR